MIGDSHAMGWGVNQTSRFSSPRAEDRPQGLERGGVVLCDRPRDADAGPLDTSHLKVLVIQYADNDRPRIARSATATTS